jgi:DNA-directed RNA polymerase specialized sigma subunit
MSNIITIELCAEDRARIDRLIAAVEKRTVQVESALEQKYNIKTEPTDDPVTKALADTLRRAQESQNKATGEQETPTPTTTPQTEETPTVEAVEQQPTARKVDRAELRAKVVELSAKGLKEQVKAVVREYGQTVPTIPEDKIAECYEKLEALEV